nr:hypothetical protein Iba_chr02bCG9610 [Ipomoea batatas]
MICEGRRYDLCLRVKYGNDAVVVYLCGLPFAAAATALARPNWHAFFYKARSVLAVAIQRQKSMIHVFEHSSNVDPCIQRQVRLCFRATQNLYFRQQELYDGDAGSVSDREEQRSEETHEEK